jgi:hypothetical protein
VAIDANEAKIYRIREDSSSHNSEGDAHEEQLLRLDRFLVL